MKIHRAYKFRLYPNQEQWIMLNKTLGYCRFLWNEILEERMHLYDELKDDKEKLHSYKYKTAKEYKKIHPFLKEVQNHNIKLEILIN